MGAVPKTAEDNTLAGSTPAISADLFLSPSQSLPVIALFVFAQIFVISAFVALCLAVLAVAFGIWMWVTVFLVCWLPDVFFGTNHMDWFAEVWCRECNERLEDAWRKGDWLVAAIRRHTPSR
jgi:hypothetical protein